MFEECVKQDDPGPGMLNDTDFAENQSAKRKTDFYSAAREKISNILLLPKAKTCFPNLSHLSW